LNPIPPVPEAGLLSLTSGGKKNKRTELDDRKLVCVMKKLGGKHLLSLLAKMLGEVSLLGQARFVITNFRQ